MYNRINQEELLVARNQEQYEELCSRILQMLTKQDATYEEGRRITSIENARRTMTGD